MPVAQPANVSPVDLLNFDRSGLEAFFNSRGEKSFRATQILKWVHQQGVTDFNAMSNLSKNLRAQLQADTCIGLLKERQEQVSADGTRKWLLELADGNGIETVYIPEEGRATLCVSSQAGCALNCSFCATARQGFNRNLSSAEIIAQIWHAEQRLRQLVPPTPTGRIVSNVVFMGMGEPLLNFDNLLPALRVLLDDFAYGLSWRRITVSTAGVVPMIDRLRETCPVSLAISLHASNDKLRDQLVPINKKYPIRELMAACRRYLQDDSRRRITVEYVLLKNINDSPEDARALLKLLRGLPAKINLIPFNGFPQASYERPEPERIEAFWNILMQAGVITVTRKTRGSDIAAACGQLAGSVQDRTRRSGRGAATPNELQKEISA